MAFAAWSLLARPAHAMLGGEVEHVMTSPLLQGEHYFRFEGRTGSRYYFGGATYCSFGNGLMAYDVVNGQVVQQSLVLPLPNSASDERALATIARLFVEEAGLAGDDENRAVAAFLDTWTAGKAVDKPIAKHIQLRTFAKPEFASVMLVLTYQP